MALGGAAIIGRRLCADHTGTGFTAFCFGAGDDAQVFWRFLPVISPALGMPPVISGRMLRARHPGRKIERVFSFLDFVECERIAKSGLFGGVWSVAYEWRRMQFRFEYWCLEG